MIIKKYLFLLVFLLTSIIACGQINIDFTKKLEGAINGQDLTVKALNGSMVVVKQSYQVKNKKNGKIYGRDGRKEFGQSYSIGVKTEAGLVLTDIALKPWTDDNAFKKVEESYEPVISLTEVREIRNNDETKFSQCPLQLGRQQPNGMWIANASDVVPNAMEIDTEEGQKDGWMIWYLAKDNLEKVPNAIISFQTLSKNLEVNGGDINIDSPVDEKAVLGGIYVCPFYHGGGHVAYRLVGMAVKEDRQWKLRTPFIGYIFEKATSTGEQLKEEDHIDDEEIKVEEQEEENVELTPIAQDKQKKKKNKK